MTNQGAKQAVKVIEKLFMKLELEMFRPYEAVFKCGEVGTKFYIVISGAVAVLTPKSKDEMLMLTGLPQEELKFDLETLKLLERLERKNISCFARNIPIYDLKKILTPFQSFGEVALSYSGYRTATICTTKDTHLISLDKKSYLEILEASSDETVRYIRFLKSAFPGLSKYNIVNIMCQLDEVHVRMNSTLFRAGETATECLIIKKGAVRLTKPFPAVNGGNELLKDKNQELVKMVSTHAGGIRHVDQDVSILGEGAVLGFKEIVEGVPYSETAVICEDNTMILRMNAKEFKKIVKYNKDFCPSFIKPINEAQKCRDFRLDRLSKILSGNIKKIKVSRTIEQDRNRYKQLDQCIASDDMHELALLTSNLSMKNKEQVLSKKLEEDMIRGISASAVELLKRLANPGTEEVSNFQVEMQIQKDSRKFLSNDRKKKVNGKNVFHE